MLFPGDVKIGPPTNLLSLTEAYKLFQMTEVTFCHCKKSCNTVQCRCYEKSRQCSSRCHKIDTVNCKNKSHETNRIEDYELTANTLSVSSAMSAFGGEIELSDGNFVKFLNTCAIDAWIVILKAVMKNNPHVFLQQDQLSENLRLVIEKIKGNNFLSVKWLIAKLTEKPVENDYVDFYGNQYSLFIKSFLEELFIRRIEWQCSNVTCPERKGFVETSDTINLTSISRLGCSVSKNDFVLNVEDWFNKIYISECGKPLTVGCSSE